MKKLAMFTMAGLIVMAVSGCSKDHEDVAEERVSLMNKMADVLEGVKDKASAEAAKSKLEDIKKDLEALTADLKEMEKPSAEEQKAIAENYSAELIKAAKRAAEEARRIAKDDELKKILGDLLKIEAPSDGGGLSIPNPFD